MTRVSSAKLFVKNNLFRKSIYRRRFFVFFFGYLDINFVVTVFDPNNGCRVPGKDDYVCTLPKSLCGFKQSLRRWYKRFNSYIIKLGYIISPFDWCVYVSKFKDATFICLVLDVDDMMIAEEKCEIEKLELLGSEVEMKDLSATKKILGMEVFRDREKQLFLSQKAYINEVLTTFVISSSEPISISCTANVHLTMYMV